MARIRSIHPGLFTDEAFASVSMGARVFYTGLLTEADDNGILDRKPRMLKGRILPFDNYLDGELLLEELEKENLIRTFAIEGRPMLAVKNFVKWQRPKKPKVVWEIPDEIAAYVRTDLREDDSATALRKRKCTEQGGKCAYCATDITFYAKRSNSLEIDHVIPSSRGGTDDDTNLVATCMTCNRSKGDMTGDEFRAVLANRRAESSRNVPEALPKAPENLPKAVFASQREEEGGRMKEIEGSLRSPSPREDAPEGGGFEKFWDEYPVGARSAPDYARRAYAKALKAGATPEGILSALQRDVERLGRREMLSPTAWLQGGSWRIVAEPETKRAAAGPRDTRFDGWSVPDEMMLKRWRDGARTLDAQHNALPEADRRAALWEAICENHPRVMAFIRESEAVGAL